MSAHRLTPAVGRGVLHVIAGTVWAGVGLMLCAYAATWLGATARLTALVLGSGGVLLGAVAWCFMFSGIVRRNIRRIDTGPARVCAFSFQQWRSYGVMLAMIALGVVLRQSLLPKHFLAVAYAAIGIALLTGGLTYLAHRSGLPSVAGGPTCKKK
jgi:hypothetical protein